MPEWKSGRVGLRRHPAKVLCGAICTVGSNPTFSEFKRHQLLLVSFFANSGWASHPVGSFPPSYYWYLINNKWSPSPFPNLKYCRGLVLAPFLFFFCWCLFLQIRGELLTQWVLPRPSFYWYSINKKLVGWEKRKRFPPSLCPFCVLIIWIK